MSQGKGMNRRTYPNKMDHVIFLYLSKSFEVGIYRSTHANSMTVGPICNPPTPFVGGYYWIFHSRNVKPKVCLPVHCSWV